MLTAQCYTTEGSDCTKESSRWGRSCSARSTPQLWGCKGAEVLDALYKWVYAAISTPSYTFLVLKTTNFVICFGDSRTNYWQVLIRRAIVDDVLPGNYKVKAGQDIMISVYNIHRSPEVLLHLNMNHTWLAVFELFKSTALHMLAYWNIA